MGKKTIDIEELDNKTIYSNYINMISEKPLGFLFWKEKINANENNFTCCLNFIFNKLYENKLKIFRWKLLHCILPTKQLLYRWRIKTDPYCNKCKTIENYEHYFITCKFLTPFLKDIKSFFKYLKLNENIYKNKG